MCSACSLPSICPTKVTLISHRSTTRSGIIVDSFFYLQLIPWMEQLSLTERGGLKLTTIFRLDFYRTICRYHLAVTTLCTAQKVEARLSSGTPRLNFGTKSA